MRKALTIAVGATSGLLLAGIVSPLILLVLPPWLRGGGVLLAASALLVAATTYGAWRISARR